MIYIDNLKSELNKLFDSLESDEVLLILKEEFIDCLVNDYEFNELYRESQKYEYFSKLETYIRSIKIGLDKQKILSNLKLNELHSIYDYEKYDNILKVLSWSVEYIESNYTEINILKESIIKHYIPNNVRHDLEKINEFLKLNNYNT